jgi:hypothetical protein
VAEDPQTGEVHPTNAGLLMFGYDPQLHLPQSEVVCIKYADTQGIRTYVDRKNFVGTLPELIDKTSSFLRQYIRVGATIRGFYREDEPEYPYEALREAVVNAVVHRETPAPVKPCVSFCTPTGLRFAARGPCCPASRSTIWSHSGFPQSHATPCWPAYSAICLGTWNVLAPVSALCSARWMPWAYRRPSFQSTSTLS